MSRRELGATSLRVLRAVQTTVEAALAQPLPAGQSVSRRQASELVVGLSGGADSLALAAAVAWLVRRERLPVPARAVVVDHQLQEGSAAVAERAAGQARSLGLDAEVVPVTVTVRGDGPEAAARVARHRALLANRDAWVLLGHTRDDQAESVLLGLARGSGTRSLAGIAARQGRLWRPLLPLSRVDTQAACIEQGLVWWADPHNDNPRYLRVRARRLLPVLERELGPGLVAALARTAGLCRDDADLLDGLAARLLVEVTADQGIQAAPLAQAHPALRRRVLLLWLRREGCDDLRAEHLRQVDALITGWHGQAGVDVPGLRVVRTGDTIAGHRPEPSPVG
ncbi:MAG: tRNA lysidine(34) synthetase TilS [Actinomycetia bacterium]|nr:tRNA lysidine(34) synthetase TilS [Actinomycetes bacterium]